MTCSLFPMTTCFYLFLCVSVCFCSVSLPRKKNCFFFPKIGYYQHHRCRLNSLKTYMTSCTSSHHFKIVQQVKSCCTKWQTPSNFQYYKYCSKKTEQCKFGGINAPKRRINFGNTLS